MSEQVTKDERVFACNACEWSGYESDLVHPKHVPDMLLCPDCRETVYEVERLT